jgi:BirA family biotin operon repressor/biotin-[acetyl-CoA-carboxylase] ligase
MVDSPYDDLRRPPLNAGALRRALVVPGGLWTDVRVVAQTGSTNADVASAARDGAPAGLVVVAEVQTAGRGRLGREWVSPPRAGIAASVLLRPAGIEPARYGWLPLLAGVALAEAVRRIAEVDAILKWPNDLLIGERKCAGVLAEVAAPGAVVVGFGLNTTLGVDELPRPDTTSLAHAGATCVDRDPLLRAVLRALANWYGRWQDATGDAEASGLREAYAFHCGTLGQQVRVQLPGGDELRGRADGVDAAGRLIVDGRALAAGDVAHLR